MIVRTGLAVLDRDGMDALTMRKVAQELDTGSASLYVYVRNRDDLLTAMLDEALAAVSLSLPEPGRGRGASDSPRSSRPASRRWAATRGSRSSRWAASPPATTPC